MSMQECIQMMNELVDQEEQKLGVGSPFFIKRHEVIMKGCDRQLLHDLMEEQREGM